MLASCLPVRSARALRVRPRPVEPARPRRWHLYRALGLPLKVALKSRVSNFKLKVTRLAAQQNQTPTEGREWGRVAAARVSGLESIELSGSPRFCQDSQSCDAGPR